MDRSENAVRGRWRQLLAPVVAPRCHRGHPKVYERPDGYLGCRECQRLAEERYRARRRAEGSPVTRKLLCPAGHTKDYLGPDGILQCRECRRQASREFARRKRMAKVGRRTSANMGT